MSPWPDCWWTNEREAEGMSANPKMAALLEAIRKPQADSSASITDIMHRCAAAGVVPYLADGAVKIKGTLTDELRALLKANKEAILEHLQEREGGGTPTEAEVSAEPWNDAKVTEYLKRARGEFGKLFDTVVKGKGGEVWREAAFGLLVDSVSRMAESLHERNMAEALASVDYVRWLCNELRNNLDRVRQLPPDGIWTSDVITMNGIEMGGPV